MKNYRVYFSFYSEENGEFDDSCYTVNANDQFEARRMAWKMRDADDNARFQSCVKQCGVEWDASPLDMVDYFRAQAAYEKCSIKRVENVKMVNAALKKDHAGSMTANGEHSYFYGKLDSTNSFARDIGKPLGMEPPGIYEEIEYAWQLVGKFDEMGENEKSNVLAKRIEKAAKWDNSAMLDIRSIFSHESIELPGKYIDLTQFFGKDGIYPERADLNEREYNYIRRWTETRHIDSLAQLPKFGEKDIIKGSEKMQYDYCTLVLRKDALTPEYRQPENMLWTPHYDGDTNGISLENANPDTRFKAENLITGIVVELRHKDFAGVLRPEFEKNIDFDTLKKEYTAQHSELNVNESNVFENVEQDEDEDWDAEV